MFCKSNNDSSFWKKNRVNIRIYDNNIYNLYLKVKEKNLPWGVRDLKKAKESLEQCKKPNINNSTKNLSQSNSNITCAYFTHNQIT